MKRVASMAEGGGEAFGYRAQGYTANANVVPPAEVLPGVQAVGVTLSVVYELE